MLASSNRWCGKRHALSAACAYNGESESLANQEGVVKVKEDSE